MRLYVDGANSGLQEGRRRLLERSYRHRTHRLRSWLTPVFRPVPIDQRAQNDELKKTKKTLSPNLSVLPNGTVITSEYSRGGEGSIFNSRGIK